MAIVRCAAYVEALLSSAPISLPEQEAFQVQRPIPCSSAASVFFDGSLNRNNAAVGILVVNHSGVIVAAVFAPLFPRYGSIKYIEAMALIFGICLADTLGFHAMNFMGDCLQVHR